MAELPPTEPKDAEPATMAANRAMLDALPFEDREDFADASRGLVAALPDGVARASSGSVMWNLGAYAFLNGREAPPFNPSLWRNAQLSMNNGLFKVVDRVFQIRGVDLANMTIIEGDTGLILIDPLGTTEVARCGLDLYFQHRPQRPVHAVIYTHSHVDHYGGVKGVATEEDAKAGRVKIIAPDGFMEAVGGENVLAGVAMTRRAMFQFGPLLLPGERGQVDAGLGKNIARGQVTLIPPNDLIVQKPERRTIDGVEIEFQLAPESEAPAEMHMFFPPIRRAEHGRDATHHLHNFIPLRGAVARDTRLWSRYIAEAMRMYGDRTEALIAQHHWPTWGREKVMSFLCPPARPLQASTTSPCAWPISACARRKIAEKLQLPGCSATERCAATTEPSATTPRRSSSAISAGTTATVEPQPAAAGARR